MGYRANSFPHMDPKTSSTGSWVTQGYPDQYAAVPVPQTPAPTPKDSAPFQSNNLPFPDIHPMTSSVPIDYITADPSVEVSIFVTSDGTNELDESQIIPLVAPMSTALQSGLTLGHAPPAAHECSKPPLSTVRQSSALHNSPIPSGTTVPSGLTLGHTPPATRECSEPPLSTVHQSSAFHNSPIPSSATVSSSRNVGGQPTNKSLTLIEEFFTCINAKFAKFTLFLKMDKDKLRDKYHMKWGKHASSPMLRHWNYYQQYYQHNLEQEPARLPDLPLDTKGYVSKCYDQFKVDLGEEDYCEILANFAMLDDLENPKTEGDLKKHTNKFQKDVMDLVSPDFLLKQCLFEADIYLYQCNSAHKKNGLESLFISSHNSIFSAKGSTFFFVTPSGDTVCPYSSYVLILTKNCL